MCIVVSVLRECVSVSVSVSVCVECVWFMCMCARVCVRMCVRVWVCVWYMCVCSYMFGGCTAVKDRHIQQNAVPIATIT